jgi:hypothetical protein
MGLVDFNSANAMLIGIVNLDTQHRFQSGVIDTQTVAVGKIKEALLLADSQVVLADIDNPYHYRDLQPSGDMDHGDHVPGGVMRPGLVLIKIAPAVYVAGIRGKGITSDQIERWRRNHNNVYGPYAHNDPNSPLGAKYTFKGDKIYFTGSKARIMRPPPFVIDRATPSCQADEIYTALNVSGGVFYLHEEGMVSDALFNEHKGIWEGGIKGLQQRALALLGNTEE